LFITTLSPGEKTITLAATDSDDAQTATIIRASSRDRLFLPVMVRGNKQQSLQHSGLVVKASRDPHGKQQGAGA